MNRERPREEFRRNPPTHPQLGTYLPHRQNGETRRKEGIQLVAVGAQTDPVLVLTDVTAIDEAYVYLRNTIRGIDYKSVFVKIVGILSHVYSV